MPKSCQKVFLRVWHNMEDLASQPIPYNVNSNWNNKNKHNMQQLQFQFK